MHICSISSLSSLRQVLLGLQVHEPVTTSQTFFMFAIVMQCERFSMLISIFNRMVFIIVILTKASLFTSFTDTLTIIELNIAKTNEFECVCNNSSD